MLHSSGNFRRSFLRVFLFRRLRGAFGLDGGFPPGGHHAHGDEHRAQNGDGRDGLPQEDPGGDDGDKGHQIDEVIGGHHAQQAHGPVPKHVAKAASHKAEEEEVACRRRRQERRGGEGGALQQHDGQRGDRAPEQRPPGDEDGVLEPAAHPPQQNGVYGPAHGGGQGQQIAPGIQLQNERAVEHHQHHPGKGDQKADQRAGAEPLLPGEMGQDGGEDGGGGHDDADVGGQGVGQGGVLRIEVYGAACEAHQKEGQLLPAAEAQLSGPQQPKGGVGQEKPRQHDLGRGVNGQQLFAGDEGGPPHRHGEGGEEAAGERFVFFQGRDPPHDRFRRRDPSYHSEAPGARRGRIPAQQGRPKRSGLRHM